MWSKTEFSTFVTSEIYEFGKTDDVQLWFSRLSKLSPILVCNMGYNIKAEKGY